MELKLTVLENGLDFLNKCIYELEDSMTHSPSIKYAILNLNSVVELIFKARLTEDHWAFVFEDLNKATYQNYLDGDFKSVNLDTALYRLKNICNIHIDQKFSQAINRLKKTRNTIEHFQLNENRFQLESIIYETLSHLIPFLNSQYLYLYDNSEFKSVSNWLHKHQNYLDVRAKLINSEVETNCNFKVDCPQCMQENTLDIDESICIFCNYSDTAVINSFIKKYSNKEGNFLYKEFDSLKTCPLCLNETLILSSTEKICKCLVCKEKFPLEKFAECGYCNSVDFIENGEMGLNGEVLISGYFCYKCIIED